MQFISILVGFMPILISKGQTVKIFSEREKQNSPLNYSDSQAKNEIYLADRDAQEHVRQIGTKIEYYELDTKNSIVDPLYNEPIQRKFSKAYIMYVYVSWPNPEFMVREDGVHTVYSGSIWMARREAEVVGLESPRPGDVVRFWDIPFFNNQAANGRDIDGAGLFFDVIEVKDDGHLYDTPYFVGFKIDLRRRTEFGPERKLGEL